VGRAKRQRGEYRNAGDADADCGSEPKQANDARADIAKIYHAAENRRFVDRPLERADAPRDHKSHEVGDPMGDEEYSEHARITSLAVRLDGSLDGSRNHCPCRVSA
jgi:hypothetical protein